MLFVVPITIGNELSGSGIGARVEVAQYAKDVINLKKKYE